MKNFFIFFIVMLFHQQVNAQDKSNKGKEFWLGYGHSFTFNYDDGVGVNSQSLTLYISAEEAATVTVSINGTSWSQVVNIPANSVDFSILIPKTGAADCRIMDEGFFERGIHIISDVPVVVYAHEYNTQLSGATMLMPVETYGYSYYSVNYTQSPFSYNVYSWFFVVAAEDNTRLEITPSKDTKGGWLAGNTYTVNLNKGEIYNVFGKISNDLSNDMTGSKVVSVTGADGQCHPVAMFSGSSIIRFCDGDGGEILKQQVFPLSAWGTRYITWHMLVNLTGNITSSFPNFYRVLVKDPATVVLRNGVPLTGLINNLYYEFQSTDGDYIEADNPILVSQYSPNANKCDPNYNPNNPSLGDPEMFFLSPIEQGMKKVIFYSTKNTAINVNYVSAIVPANSIASLKIDGAPVTAASYTTHPNNNNYIVVVKRLLGAAAQHTIECDSAFSTLVYGIGNFESYGYTGGTLINNLNSIALLQNTYNSTTQPNTYTCPNSPFQLTIKTAYRAGSINWQFSKVSGISPAKDTLLINPIATDSLIINGREYFTYTLNSDYYINDTGIFYIPVSYTSEDIDHCSHTENTTIEIQVKQGPIADFSFLHDGCTKDTAFLSNTSMPGSYTIDRYIWYYADNTTDSSENSKKVLSAPVNPVTYRIIATNGCLKDTTKLINTFSQPLAAAAYDRDICIGDSIRFTNTSSISTGNIAAYKWDFGDGTQKTFSAGTPFYYTYPGVGNYRVSLNVISDNGCTSDSSIIPMVSVLNKPSASFIFSGKPCMDSTIQFTPTTVPSTDANSIWYWDFGDGKTQAGSGDGVITHTYSSPQSNAPVRFAVATSQGCISDTIAVPLSIYPEPVVGFTTNKPEYCAGENVHFTNTSSTDATTFIWNFGNETATTIPPFSKVFTDANTYNIQLAVNSDKGCGSKPFTQTVTINPIPVAAFTINAESYCLGKPIIFNDNSTGNITQWQWDLGNGTSTSSPPITNTYTVAGTYPVQLIVTSNKGCVSDNYAQQITINPTPVAGFTIDATTYCSGKPIRFINSSTGNIAQWHWNFGNGSSTTSPPLNRNFNAGLYDIELIVSSDNGCISDPFKQSLTIYPTPQINAGPDINLQEGNAAVINATVNDPSLYQYTWSPSTGLSSTSILNPVTSTSTTTVYIMQASGGPGNCIATDSVKVIVFKQLFIPNAFTPNGDGTNDIWNIPALNGSTTAVVTIYNRWGQIIYQSNGYSRPWDGRYKGQLQPGGAYYYIIQPDINKPEKVSGSVILIR